MVLALAQQFKNATAVLNLAGWCDVTYFLKRATYLRATGFLLRCILSLYSMPPSNSFITLYSHLVHYFKVNCKSNHLAIIANTIYQSICMYILVHTKYLWYIIAIDFHAIKNITTGSVKQKKTKGISDNGCLCPLNILC